MQTTKQRFRTILSILWISVVVMALSLAAIYFGTSLPERWKLVVALAIVLSFGTMLMCTIGLISVALEHRINRCCAPLRRRQ